MHAAATETHSAALCTLLRSFGQSVLQPNAFTGAGLVAAWLLVDPRLACAAPIGAGLASAAHLLLGGGASSFDAGLLGFNVALTAFALVDGGIVSMLVGTAVSVVLQIMLQAVTAHFGGPTMTAPFVLATWSMQWLRHRATRDAIASEQMERMEPGRSITTSASHTN